MLVWMILFKNSAAPEYLGYAAHFPIDDCVYWRLCFPIYRPDSNIKNSAIRCELINAR